MKMWSWVFITGMMLLSFCIALPGLSLSLVPSSLFPLSVPPNRLVEVLDGAIDRTHIHTVLFSASLSQLSS